MAAHPEPLPVPGVGFGLLLPLDGEWVKATLMFLGVCPLQEEAVPCARGECQGCAVEQPFLELGAAWKLGAWLGAAVAPAPRCWAAGISAHVAPSWGDGWGQCSVLLQSSWRAEGKNKAGSLCGRNSDMAAREAEPRLG